MPIHSNTTTNTYRVDPSAIRTLKICAVAFVIIWVGSTAVAFFNPDGSFPEPILAAMICFLFWGAWLIFTLRAIQSYARHELTLSDTHITIQNKTTVKIPLNQIEHIKWQRITKHGRIRIHYQNKKIKIDPSSYPANDIPDIINYFREKIDLNKQSGWDLLIAMKQQLNNPQLRPKFEFSKKTLFPPGIRRSAHGLTIIMTCIFIPYVINLAREFNLKLKDSQSDNWFDLIAFTLLKTGLAIISILIIYFIIFYLLKRILTHFNLVEIKEHPSQESSEH